MHTLESRAEKEARFLQVVQKTLQGGGHVLLPVLALGMAQELLLVLEEYWAARPELHGVPVYYASSLARKCMSVYYAFVHSMNENVQARFARGDNPFVFKCVFFSAASLMWGVLTSLVKARLASAAVEGHREEDR